MSTGIAILDFGSQYTQLIARRVRELQVYCELFPWDAPAEVVMALQPVGFILSGGPASVYAPGAPQIPTYVLASGRPILGICYGMQALAHALGGKVAPAPEREYGPAEIETILPNPLLPPGRQRVWMSHGDRIEILPPGFNALARSPNSPIAAMGDLNHRYYGVQFHPEVHHTPGGKDILRRFVVDICGATPDWTPESIITQAVERIRAQVGHERALAAVSGGVDSSVAAALVQRAIGDRLVAVFVDTGLLRQGEREQVELAFRHTLGANLIVVDAASTFLNALKGITDPEEKRRIIGETFIRVFEQEARRLGTIRFLVQGTIYPDVVESRAPDRAHAQRIKTHHNVGGLPPDLSFELVEPLRYLFKDEVRRVGEALGLPPALVWRQPFPGPGLAVRCLGEVTAERLARLRAADAIFTGELERAGLLQQRLGEDESAAVAQAFAVLLPVQSVGVMGDQRTYQDVVALRAVTTQDFMTAHWARLSADLLERVANRIVNEVDGINRVVYDITSKPPATIEWE
ncbi:glutamine-hydrolyzing GMP synthase [Thermanaerothrix sp.]|jgi:GMP synthase (glutamine-hydrolysing)|uniref:glutamine-hydrolyzing GMP synthase n=1 Tax=Thermanaerothrix sp. TaxID=2972675 RepID=UPI002ADD8F41|nr:glutamine-hydrolyzing GMP synthase [Thermanaerothrix sp.]